MAISKYDTGEAAISINRHHLAEYLLNKPQRPVRELNERVIGEMRYMLALS